MKLLFSVFALLAAALGASAGAFVLLPKGAPAHARLERDAGDLVALVPDEDERAVLLAHTREAARSARRVVGPKIPGLGIATAPWAASVAIRSAVARTALPLLVAAGAIGLLAGLLERHRRRENYEFHSVTWSYLGKALVSLSLALYVFTVLSPWAIPIWLMYASALGTGIGPILYFGNLPPKI